MKKSRLLGVLGVVLWYTSLSLSAIQEEELRIFLSKGLAMPVNALNDSRLILKCTQYAPNLESRTRYLVSEYTRKYNKVRYDLLYSSTEPSKEIHEAPDLIDPRAPSIRISDGVYLLTYYSTAGSRDTETQKGRAFLEAVNERSFFTKTPDYQIRPELQQMLGGVSGVTPAMILQDERCRIHNELVSMDNIPVYMVECPVTLQGVELEVTYWLAPERSGLPVRMEMADKKGNIFKSLQTKRFCQVGGVWFIKEIVEEVTPIPEFPERGTFGRRTSTFEAISVELNPALDESSFFSTSPERLPPGTLFQDLIAGVEYTIGEGPVSDEAVRSVMKKALADIRAERPLTSAESNAAGAEYHPPVPGEAGGKPKRPLLARDGINTSEKDATISDPARTRWILALAGSMAVLLVVALIFVSWKRS